MNDNLKNFNFSYSSLNAYETCAYQFKLLYLDRVERANNFFSDFGSFCHLVIEKYFKKELEIWDLLDFYEKEYYNHVKEPPPSFMPSASIAYYDAGHKFFKEFSLDREEYEIIDTEQFVKGIDREVGIVLKPDLIFKDKSTDEIIIMDFKTSEIVNKYGSVDEEKLNGYKKQINIYIHYLWFFKNIEIKKARLWFIRSNTFYEWEYSSYDSVDDIEWVIETAKKVFDETEWKYNNSNKFMCNVLCSARNLCQYRAK